MSGSTVFERFVHKYSRLPTEFDPDYLEMLRMSKYRILAVHDLKPGKCANCRASKDDGRQYIDFGLEVDWYGIVYLCGLCLKDIAEKMHLFVEIENRITQLENRIKSFSTLQDQGTELQDVVLKSFEGVKEYFDSLRSLRDDSFTGSDPGMGAGKESNESVPNSTKSRVTKSN